MKGGLKPSPKMDWTRLFTLLVMTALVSLVSTEGTRKKIRIHIPQKVKHIHHHKKIYITQHSATAQYAPAFLPTAEGTVAIPASALALPTGMSGLVPLKPIPLYEERRSGRLPGVSSANSPLLPMYRARGYYGPAPAWERPGRETDLQPPPYSPAFSGPSGPSTFSSPSGPAGPSQQSKRVKLIKVTEPRKKKIIKKKKPKRIIIQDLTEDDERPVSTFHEQFYADVDQAGTIKKTRKPKRVEKIIDGDTEHIHTYSEEHIHRVVFDEPKIPDVSGVASLAGSSAANSLLPLNSPSQSLFSVDPSLQQPLLSVGTQNAAFSSLSALGSLGAVGSLNTIGSLGSPGNIEYMGYNPSDVTHDHVYHDHGEVGEDFDFNKNLGIPPNTYKAPKFSQVKPRPNGRWVSQENIVKPTKNPDYAYYENMYTPGHKPKPTAITYPRYAPNNEVSHPSYNSEGNFEEVRPTFKPKYKYKPKPIASTHHVQNPNIKPSNGVRSLYHSADAPYSTSSTIIHDAPYKPTKTSYQGVQESPLSGFTSYKDQFTSFRDMYAPPTNYEYDAYASSSNSFNKQNDEMKHSYWQTKSKGKSKKKSISTQNISFGGQDHKMIVDHMADSSNISPVVSSSDDDITTEHVEVKDIATPAVEYGITDYSPVQDYYTAMAIKAFQENPIAVPDASNNNYHVVEPPLPHTTEAPSAPSTTTAHVPMTVYVQDVAEHTTPSSTFLSTNTMGIPKKVKRAKSKPSGVRQQARLPMQVVHSKQPLQVLQAKQQHKAQSPIPHEKKQLLKLSPEERGKLKYGDRLQDRYDEY